MLNIACRLRKVHSPSFKTVNYGKLVAYFTLSVQSDLILPELHQHIFQRWTALQQRVVDELIE